MKPYRIDSWQLAERIVTPDTVDVTGAKVGLMTYIEVVYSYLVALPGHPITPAPTTTTTTPESFI